MFFTQFEFLFFLLLLFVILAVIKRNDLYKITILTASIFFYGYWDVRFLILLFGYIVVNYFCGLFFSKNNRQAKACLICAIVFNIGILGVFKYYNFFTENLSILLSRFGIQIGVLHLILPLGISFFSFQCVSYVIDVYQKKSEPCRSFLDFSFFILYFPKLMVGPIVRATDFLPMLRNRPEISFELFFAGARKFLFGLFSKLVIADTLALYVNTVFDNYAVFNGLTLFFAIVAYSIQIYCDFCGYSDMAIGCSRMLGYDLCENFNLPYLSGSVTEFWRRWHISLSSWLRDYLYIPMGGNKKGEFRSYLNSFLTMLIGGLWHGSSWTFIIWGAWHGVALVIHRLWKKYTTDRLGLPYGIALILTIVTVMFGWLFFRATTFQQAVTMLVKIITFSSGIGYYDPTVLYILPVCLLAHVAAKFGWHKKWYECKPSVWGFFVLWMLLLSVLVFRPTVFQPFVYNQF